MVKRILITLIAVGGLFTCGKQVTENKTTNINVAVNWGTSGAPAAGTIDSIKVTVSSSTATWTETFPYSAHIGTISNITENTSITVTVVGLKNPGTIVYQGVYAVNNVTEGMDVTVAVNSVVPTIITQPLSQTIVLGNSVTFSVLAAGSPTLAYQWKRNDSNISNANSDSLVIAAVQLSDSGHYSVKVTNSQGFVTSDSVKLTILFAPVVTIQPQAKTITAGQTTALSVAAIGNPAPTFQWKKNGVDIANAVSDSFKITSALLSDSGLYSVKVTNNKGSILSDGVKLTVLYQPIISIQPQSQTITTGQKVTFSVSAYGNPSLTFQWKKDTVNISGATSASYSIDTVHPADTGSYSVSLTNSQGTIVSAAAVLTVLFAPLITIQPHTQTAYVGQQMLLNVSTTANPTPSYQWRKNGTNISNANSSSYLVSNVQLSDSGTYTVKVTNVIDSVVSSNAVITVSQNLAAPSISTQPQAQTAHVGDSVTFSVVANANPAPTYQWEKNGSTIFGATGNSYTIHNVQASDSGTYKVAISNSQGNDTSSGAKLTVNSALTAPSISVQPLTVSATVGGLATFSVIASGNPSPAYKWLKNGMAISGANGNSFSITNTQFSDSGTYKVVVSNSQGIDTSNSANLTVTPVLTAPSISTQPQSQTVTVGGSIRFIVVATGNPSPSYQWFKNEAPISQATGSSYAITSTQLTDSGTYKVVVSNSQGIDTSNVAKLTVSSTPVTTLTDTDGNVYQTVTIGTQVWMTTNLKTTRYNDGRAIPLVTDGTAWSNLIVQSTPGYCWYNDSISYGNTYGALYNWYAVNTGKLAPKGWHVPTDSEWEVLGNYLGGDATAGGPLKEAGTTHWLSPNAGATNSSGFSALPGGYRIGYGTFNGVGNVGSWWSSTVNDTASGCCPGSWYRDMGINNTYVNRSSDGYPKGFSVRCVKD